MRKKLVKRKRTSQRRRSRKIFRGAVSPEVLVILLLVLLIFLSSMFLVFKPFGGASSSTTDQSTVPIPTQYAEAYRGGMESLGITPLPSTYNTSMCSPITNDVVLLIDNSGSMKGSKLVQAKEAAKLFAELIAINPASRIGIVAFNSSSNVLSPLTNSPSTITAGIENLTSGSNTCIQCGVIAGAELFSGSSSAEIKRSVVLLSDGKANYADGRKVNEIAGKLAAQNAIAANYSTNRASYYTIAIGEDADESFMAQMAVLTGGGAFSTKTFDALSNTFAHVATDICTGDNESDEY